MKINFLKFIENYVVWIIVLLALVLRFWNLGLTPPSLYWDEVSQGFNSYSILTTGFDEHHEFLPLTRFQAFGDYKAPVYIYLDVLPMFLFGQTEFAIRFPSAFFGTLTVLLAYFLTIEIFYSYKNKKMLGLFSAFFLAVSPWHIQLSRAAYEANIATFFTVLGLLLFFIAKRKNAKFLLLSIVSFVIAFYSFNAHRVFIPLLIILLLFVYWRELFVNFKKLVLAGIIGIILLLPFLIYFKTPESRLRFQEVNIFSDISVIEQSNRLINADDNSITAKIFHNRRVLYGLSYVKHYFDFFNPTYLFFKGDGNPRFSTQDTGELYLYILPFLIIGMYVSVKNPSKNKYFLIGWFLLAPIAGATARETPHALRSETFILIYEIFAGLGFWVVLERILQFKKNITVPILSLFVIVIIYYLINFLHIYYVHMPQTYSQDWQFGYKQAVLSVEKIKNNYDEILFTNAYGRAYIYVLWYGKYQPQEYWQNGKVTRDAFGLYNVLSFEKYVFSKPNGVKTGRNKKVLFVGKSDEIPNGSRKLSTVKFLDGSMAFVIADNLK